MFRQRLIRFKGQSLTQDTADALKALEERAHEVGGWRIQFGVPAVEGDPCRSLVPAGREVRMSLRHPGATPQRAVEALWGFAVPLGFAPLDRYPNLRSTSDVFHHFGPWQPLYDRLLAEGRGHLAWPSVCAAAQTDVGAWAGDKEVPRFVQGQLHRIGANVGQVDGVIGDRCTQAIQGLGLHRPSIAKVGENLRGMAPPRHPDEAASKGHVVIPGRDLAIAAFGDVAATRTTHGAALDVRGPGRIVIDIMR